MEIEIIDILYSLFCVCVCVWGGGGGGVLLYSR